MSASQQKVCVPRAWLESILAATRGTLPAGHIGDCVFLLRGQIIELLDKEDARAESASQDK